MRWAWIFGLLLMYLHAPPKARACKCVPTDKTFEEEAADAGLIFSGRVVTRRLLAPEQRQYLQFEVVPGTIWKGPVVDRYVIYSDGSSCGSDFTPGQEYVFMLGKRAGLRPDSLLIGRCGAYYSLLNQARELGIIKALFVPSLRANLGAEGPRLNANEAEYFAGILPGATFHFDNQQLGFFIDHQLITKQQYLDNFLTATMLSELVVFTPAEQAASNGYAAVLVAWPTRKGQAVSRTLYRRRYKSGSMVSPALRRRLVRRLGRGRENPFVFR